MSHIGATVVQHQTSTFTIRELYGGYNGTRRNASGGKFRGRIDVLGIGEHGEPALPPDEVEDVPVPNVAVICACIANGANNNNIRRKRKEFFIALVLIIHHYIVITIFSMDRKRPQI